MKEIWTYDGPLPEAFCPQSVTLVLEHDLDISRGDTIVGPDNPPGMSADGLMRYWKKVRTAG